MFRDSLELLDPIPRLALRPTLTIQEGRRHARIGELFFPPHDSLLNRHGRGADRLNGADHDEVVAEPPGLPVADVHLDDRIGAAAAAELGELVDAHSPDHVGARPLHIFEIVGIIDDAVGVGVLEIDGEREMVLVAGEAAAIGLVEVVHPDALASGDSQRNPA